MPKDSKQSIIVPLHKNVEDPKNYCVQEQEKQVNESKYLGHHFQKNSIHIKESTKKARQTQRQG